MKQFSLEEYLKNPKRKVITRDGYPVKIICTNFHLSGCPIVAEIDDKEYRNKQSWTFDKNGRYDSCKSHRKDLFFAPEKKEGWVNLFNLPEGPYLGRVYSSKEVAEAMSKKCGLHPYIATIKIEWEE